MSAEAVIDSRNEPPSALPGLTAERIHAAITAAEAGSTRDLFAIYRDVLTADTHLQSVIETRFLAVIGETPSFQPLNENDPEDVAATEAIKAAVERLPDFLGVCSSLLWGSIWPLSVMERTYKPANIPGLTYDWGSIVPIQDTLFQFSNGYLEIEEVDKTSRQPTGKFTRPDPARYMIHRGHMLRTPDNWGGPMRSLVWWFFLGVMNRDWWVRFLDKFGTPFMVGKFDKSDDRSRQVLERAFRLSTKIGGVVVNQGTQIELLKAATGDSATAFQAFHDVCNREKSKRVLGQVSSTESQSTGLGSSVGDHQAAVRQDIRQWDAARLAQTLRQQLFAPWLRLNGFTGAAPNIRWGAEEQEETTTTATVLSQLKNAGLRLSQAGLPVLSSRVGLPIERDEVSPAVVPEPLRLAATPPPLRDPSAAANSISRESAAAISAVFCGSLAPVRDILLLSETPEAASKALTATFTDWDAQRIAELVEMGLAAGAWNGAQ